MRSISLAVHFILKIMAWPVHALIHISEIKHFHLIPINYNDAAETQIHPLVYT